ncbi:MAG: hypothetical protein MUO64_11020 [Anaerolineales bacterium]|nr:hypothetical protein [Anaerolineales bacterium]
MKLVNLFRRNYFSWVIILAVFYTSLFVFLGYSYYGSSFIQNFWSNWLSTLLGVIIGVPILIWVSGIQERKIEKERKEKILKSLYGELVYCKIELDRMVDREIIKLESGVLSSILRKEIWNAYSDGGELEWIKDVSLIAQIADSYYSIRAVSDLADRYYDSVQYATEESSVRRINEVFNTLVSSIEYSTGSVTKTINTIRGLIPNVTEQSL